MSCAYNRRSKPTLSVNFFRRRSVASENTPPQTFSVTLFLSASELGIRADANPCTLNRLRRDVNLPSRSRDRHGDARRPICGTSSWGAVQPAVRSQATRGNEDARNNSRASSNVEVAFLCHPGMV